MERNEKIDRLTNISRESDLHDILMDLLPQMGYEDVTLTHERGSLPENGKDIVASKFDLEENRKDWFAFVVKKGDIRGTSQGIQEIKSQVLDCFNYSWHSIVKGKNIRIAKVKAVISGKYTGGAIQKILDDSQLMGNPNLNFWSSIELVEHIDKFFPRFWLKGSKSYKHYIEIFQAKNKEDDITKAIGLKNEKIKKIIDFAIQPKLIELSVTDEGDIKKKSFDINSVAKLDECSLIVGESGSGKSTYFKQLSNDIIFQNGIRNDYEYYPFIIRFSEFDCCGFDVEEVLRRHILSTELKSVGIDVESLFKIQNFVLFIDALDEVGTEELKDKALESIEVFRKKYPQVKIYCSSRPADSLLGSCQRLKFKYLEITNISQKQTELFLNRYFGDEQIKCQRLLKSLKDSHILEKLPRTPLTLALIAAIFDEREMEIPATISDLYKYFVDLLLSKSIKGSTLDLLQVGIHRSALSYIAEYLHVNRRHTIPKTDLINELSNFALQRGHKYDVNLLIEDLINGIGILIVNDRDDVQFKHLSFQEYFTAYQFYNHNVNGKSYFIDNFNDVWWQNVAIFYAGMTKDSPELLKDILEKSEPQNFREYLINLAGIGYLIQALYNTPIQSRIEGIRRNILNANKAVNFLLNTQEKEFDILKAVCNTRYGVYKVVSYWYEFHHTSITLKEPLENGFRDIKKLIESEDTTETERYLLEYSAYLVASTLAEIDDYDFNYLKELLDCTSARNNFVRALILSNFDEHYKKISKDEKRRKKIKKFKNKLDLLNLEKIQDKVNLRLLDGKPLIPKFQKGKKN